MSGPTITIDKLNLTLGNTNILEDVSLEINPGEVHCLIGPNGGGKTSLVRSILGQMPHTGSIKIQNGKGEGKAVIGYVPQFLEFDKSLPVTVNDFMAITCQRRPAFFGLEKAYKKTVDSALDRVGLIGKRNSRLGSLSGGERQRVLFAQALIPAPELLILDEPMAGMDEVGNQIFEKIVLESSEDDITVLWIHHDLEQVQRVAQTVTSLNRQILFHGPTKDVLTNENILGMFHQPSSKLETKPIPA